MTTVVSSEGGVPSVSRTVTTVPLVLGVFVAALIAGGASLGVYPQNVHNGLIAAAFTAVGVFVLHRRPDNREARLFSATGGAHSVLFIARQYGLYASDGVHSLPTVRWITWIGVWPLALVLVLVAVTIMSFPDGRLPSRRWRAVVWAMTAVGAALAAISALWPVEYADNDLPVDHPLVVGGGRMAYQLWSVVGPTTYILFQLTWVSCLVLRLRRASGDEARQLKWFVYSIVMAGLAMAAGLVAFHSPAIGVLTVPLIAAAAGSAILKYRLYDIDVAVNKTLVVGVMAVLVSVAYVAAVAGVGGVVGLSVGTHVGLSLFVTAVIAVAFDPARRRVQRGIDRLVYGDRPTPYEALARLSSQLSHEGDLFAGLASTVADGVGATAVTLWVGSDHELVASATWPPTAVSVTGRTATLSVLEGGDRDHVRPIVHQGKLCGAVTLTKAPGEALSPSEELLLRDLAAQAGLVIDNVGLGAELKQRLDQISEQAADLRAAAKRIVAAQDEARRQIERDLHDGSQQRLVTLALGLQAIGQRARAIGDPDLLADLDDARQQLALALSELREMARGIHPAVLTEDGLEAALGFLAERSPIPMRIDLRLHHRLGRDVEATAYFIVSEALTNAAKHSQAARVTVTGAVHDGRLTIEIADNGRGGGDGNWGSGLQGLTDRVATLNGWLTVQSPLGGGTRLRAEIPCA